MPFVPDPQPTQGRFVPDAPPASPPGQGGFKLGPGASSFVRGPVEGLAGAVTAIPDLATAGGNWLGNLIDPGAEPDVKSPGQSVQDIIDKFTTAPTGRGDKLKESILSGAFGSLAGPKIPKPSTASSVVKRLAGEGVTMTPGQRAGGLGNALEEKISKIIPQVGNARGKAVEQWNTARLNAALKDAGGTAVPKGMTGNDALRHTYQELQGRYTAVLSKMKGALGNGPGSFRESIDNVKAIGQNLDPKHAADLNKILDRDVINRFTVAGRASGTTVKEIGERLRTEADKYRGGGPDDRHVAEALDQVRADLRKMLLKENPKQAPDLLKIDKGYAQYKTSAKAGNYSATKGGQSTTGQRLQAIRARDKSKDKNAFATGTAPGQSEATEAQSVLGNVQPDSGTPMGMALLTGDLKQILGGLAGGTALYNQPMLKFLQQQALKDPKVSRMLGIAGGAQQAPNPLGPQQDAQ